MDEILSFAFSLPWPILLLAVVTAFTVYWFVYVYSPLLEEHELLKDKLKDKVEDIHTKFTKFDPSEFYKLDIINEKCDKIVQHQSDIVRSVSDLHRELSNDFARIYQTFDEHESVELGKFNDNKTRILEIMRKIDDLKEKMIILSSSIDNKFNRFKD